MEQSVALLHKTSHQTQRKDCYSPNRNETRMDHQTLIDFVIEVLRKEQALHKKSSSGYYNLEVAILKLERALAETWITKR